MLALYQSLQLYNGLPTHLKDISDIRFSEKKMLTLRNCWQTCILFSIIKTNTYFINNYSNPVKALTLNGT